MRADLEKISSWIKPGSKVLDLGCGDGTLLAHLQETLQVNCYGLEIDRNNVLQCVKNGVNVIQTDLESGIHNYGLNDYFTENSFDYVIMTQAIQVMNHPDQLLDEILRIGKQGIITMPNFGYWRNRLQLFKGGVMPITDALPNRWYNTPNIHLCTIKDFELLCKQKDIDILQSSMVNNLHESSALRKLLPNLFAEVALYRFTRTNNHA